MGTAVLIIIYIAFISLGLPDSILGVSLPAMREEMGMSLGAGGAISMVVLGGTIVSSFFSAPVIRKFGTARVTLISSIMTGGALLGFSLAPGYWWLIALAVPLGLGGGTVDTALNNYVALNYKARHMNWLHSFWGVGATLGPLTMAWALSSHGSWRFGYRGVSGVQFVLAVILLLSLPLWKMHKNRKEAAGEPQPEPEPAILKSRSVFRIPGAVPAFATMLFYCSVEASVGLLGSSFLVEVRGMIASNASFWMSLYFGGITVGRFMSGVASMAFSNRQLIGYGSIITLVGSLLLLIPLSPAYIGLGFVLMGLGLSPIFPAMLHETPTRFGSAYSQKIIGYQMGFGYVGSAFIPPMLAWLFQYISLSVYPYLLIGLILALIFSSRIIDRGITSPAS